MSRNGEPPDEGDSDTKVMESTQELLERYRAGDAEALDLLYRRHRTRLQRWASGRLPRRARSMIDTEDLVQDAMMRTLSRVDVFEVRHPGAFQAYVRTALMNRIRSRLESLKRRPSPSTLDEEHADERPSPLVEAEGKQFMERYEAALGRLPPTDQAVIILVGEMGCSYREAAIELGKGTPDAARMAYRRAVDRLLREMANEAGTGNETHES